MFRIFCSIFHNFLKPNSPRQSQKHTDFNFENIILACHAMGHTLPLNTAVLSPAGAGFIAVNTNVSVLSKARAGFNAAISFFCLGRFLWEELIGKQGQFVVFRLLQYFHTYSHMTNAFLKRWGLPCTLIYFI